MSAVAAGWTTAAVGEDVERVGDPGGGELLALGAPRRRRSGQGRARTGGRRWLWARTLSASATQATVSYSRWGGSDAASAKAAQHAGRAAALEALEALERILDPRASVPAGTSGAPVKE